jgi:hypothetical protein
MRVIDFRQMYVTEVQELRSVEAQLTGALAGSEYGLAGLGCGLLGSTCGVGVCTTNPQRRAFSSSAIDILDRPGTWRRCASA